MKAPKKTVNNTWRFWFIAGLLLLVAGGLFYRMLDLMVFDRVFLQNQGDVRTLRVVPIPAYRGMIEDRYGAPLAISTPVEAIWVNPKKLKITPKQLKQVASLLDLNASDIQKHIHANSKKEFLFIKRLVDPSIAARVLALNIKGVNEQKEFRRYYPEGEVAAQLVGITNIDDNGQEGMELAYNGWMEGVSGKKRVLKDRLGHIVANVDIIREPTPGHDLKLSIDRRIQYVAYRTLKEAVAKNKAKSGSVVVMNAKTGEVLAMATVPSFNPNNRPDIAMGRYRNRAVTDVFEPGSTNKAFTVANALSSGEYTPSTVVNTSPGWMIVGGHRVRDHRDNGKIDLTRIIQISSNMGAAKITLSLPPESLPHLLQTVGFGQRTTSDFPGESAGYLPYHANWPAFSLATLSFGYGLSVTTLQLAAAYQVLANDGVKMPVSLLKENSLPSGQQVLSPETAKQVVNMLQAVVEKGGTGYLAQVPGYHVAGKTGTSRIVGPRGYEKDHHNAVFVGMAPASRPQLVVAVFIHDPEGKFYYGGLVSAPVFSKVMANALRIMDVPPDRYDNLPKNKA